MANKSIDITNQKFSMLTAKHIIGKRGNTNLWLCMCDCGNQTTSTPTDLRGGRKTSCGCKKHHKRKPRPDLSELNKLRATHSMSGGYTYATWSAMKSRCLDKNDKDYKNYGARGITICNEWISSFAKFHQHMGDRPKGHTIDRIDNNGNYEPGNCRWAEAKTQCNNTRTNYYVEYNGKVQTAKQWAEELGIVEYKTLLYRLRTGWDTHEAMTTPSTIKRK